MAMSVVPGKGFAFDSSNKEAVPMGDLVDTSESDSGDEDLKPLDEILSGQGPRGPRGAEGARGWVAEQKKNETPSAAPKEAAKQKIRRARAKAPPAAPSVAPAEKALAGLDFLSEPAYKEWRDKRNRLTGIWRSTHERLTWHNEGFEDVPLHAREIFGVGAAENGFSPTVLQCIMDFHAGQAPAQMVADYRSKWFFFEGDGIKNMLMQPMTAEGQRQVCALVILICDFLNTNRKLVEQLYAGGGGNPAHPVNRSAVVRATSDVFLYMLGVHDANSETAWWRRWRGDIEESLALHQTRPVHGLFLKRVQEPGDLLAALPVCREAIGVVFGATQAAGAG